MLVHLERHVTLSLADMADELAVWENDCPLTEIPAEDVRDIYLELYHTHLPRLVHANVAVYDQEQDLVSRSGYGAAAVADIRVVDEQSIDDYDDTVSS
ncbi:DNA-binding protein [Haloferax mediterranei ATCC 33500]|uniref:DNA-binding protein n=2 Tax=Haloferacaceae TaxID=1644056 RepID=I3R787_HALMT|nr:hypothetical protein HFX_2412 [Haloferax mediterranei ATCC 33500]AHZ23471.1 DNA-binding protein [Haloferax mediterranei ATCC 33500]ELZ99643.1 hypothetical protein C439_13854 [Haloferax mediterranei ATCC 33500]QCQ76674.1 DNA-binding protein [Haloferax mediterranei ATCC 33500]